MNFPQHPTGPTPEPKNPLAYDRLKQLAHFQASFLGTASHELRAPINKVISLHQLILEGLCEGPEEEREFLEQANQAIYQVLKNLDLLIQVSKLHIGVIHPEFQPISVGAVLEKVHRLMEMKCLNRRCRLVLQAPTEVIGVMSDGHWLQQLLMLLLDGSLAAGGSMMTLSVQPQLDSLAAVRFTTDVALSYWQEPAAVEVSSTDRELSTTELSPGFRYQIAQQMASPLNCTISCQETQDGGTEILVYLPIADIGHTSS
jgi:K+-sensing histidine kinase KdpD